MIREVQKCGIEALKVFSQICEENNLTYFMIGGTLLGAIRHKGFIPWDDDIDVAMPRKDYEKLLLISEKIKIAPYYFDHYTRSNNMLRCMIMALKNYNIKIDYQHDNHYIEHSNFKIDILPIDGTPNNKFVRMFFYTKLMVYRALFKFTVIDEVDLDNLDMDRPIIEKILIAFARKTKIGAHIDGYKLLNRLEMCLKSYDMDKSNICGTFLGAYKLREFVDCKYFHERNKYQFEDSEFYGTMDYDGYLSCIYGDYRRLPPIERRIGKHKILKVEKVEDKK